MAKKGWMLTALLLGAAVLCAGCGGPSAPAPTPEPTPQIMLEAVSVSPAGRRVLQMSGELFFPGPEDWKYHFVYAYPQVDGEDYAAAAVNESYQMALGEVTQMMLPMGADRETAAEGQVEMRHDFAVQCNNDRLLSIVLRRSQTGEDGTVLSMESLTFDMSGEYVGEPLTLRGCLLALVSGENPEEMTAEAYPQIARILASSSDSIGEKVTEKLYPEFQRLQESGRCRPDIDRESFTWEFAAAASFFIDGEGRAVFYFSPEMLTEPSFQVPLFRFTPEEIDALLV